MYRSVLALLFASVLLLSGCAAERQRVPREKDTQGTDMAGQSSDMSGEEGMYMDTTENVIYLAGGCFWGTEQLMQSIPGVIDAQSGYANGTCEADATYQTVCKGDTGFRETVRVEYDPEQVSLDALLLAVLIDRNGAGVTAREICACMWEDGSNDRKNINYLYQLFFDLRHALELAGASEILRQNGVYYAVDTERIDCDYYHYLNTGKPEFHGEYMTQYSWAENTAGLLWNK